MSFQKLYARIRDIDQDTTQLNESVAECGNVTPAGVTPPVPVTMNLTLNANGIDHIKELLNLMSNAQATTISEPMAMPQPGMPIGAPPIETPEVPDVDITTIRSLAGLDAHTEPDGDEFQSYEEPDGDEFQSHEEPDGDEVKVKTNSQEKEGSYDANTTPKPSYQDSDYMVKDLAGGLNRPKKQFRKEYPGDNPMAAEDIAALEQSLRAQYKESYKTNIPQRSLKTRD